MGVTGQNWGKVMNTGDVMKKSGSMFVLVFLFCVGLAVNTAVDMHVADRPAESLAHLQLMDYKKTAN
ncbi:hypothetical protein OLMES_0987 [Oleiphilus messinensis]|uniref:Uncharacterized protein n=1 Tax=Oleiphilus messinensis TaxID=141451 RepID=A0A1Y0I6L9_9GAMM|nr:hypothetical protein OLMES_0987 [Oleiphilus messinensis]